MAELSGMMGDLPNLEKLSTKLENSNEWATWNEGFWLRRYCEGALNGLKQHSATKSFFNTVGVVPLKYLDDSDFLLLHNNLEPEEEDRTVQNNAHKELEILESLDDTSAYYITAKSAAKEFPVSIFFPKWNSPFSGALQHLAKTREDDAGDEPEANTSSSQPVCELYCGLR